MKKPLLFILLVGIFFYSFSGQDFLSPKKDSYFFAKGRRLPTKEEVLATHFKKELPQAKELLNRESGINPTAVNKSSGACGVGQSLPCAKMGCNLTFDIHDFVCQVSWTAGYIKQRYGSVKNALAFHDKNNYY
jgi:hypothetical protein